MKPARKKNTLAIKKKRNVILLKSRELVKDSINNKYIQTGRFRKKRNV
jgi:hypothetical protein